MVMTCHMVMYLCMVLCNHQSNVPSVFGTAGTEPAARIPADQGVQGRGTKNTTPGLWVAGVRTLRLDGCIFSAWWLGCLCCLVFKFGTHALMSAVIMSGESGQF
jgi:hypothetical protein